jgi:hypothetical protein
LTINSDLTGGSGAVADWVIRGGTGYGGDQAYIYVLGMPNIGNGGFLSDHAELAMPSVGRWWTVWKGQKIVRRGAFSRSSSYNSSLIAADVVDYYAFNRHGNGILQWMATNPAKSGGSGWTTPTDLNGGDWVPLSPNSFQALDLDVAETTLFKGNWNAKEHGIPASESLQGEVLPPSLYRSVKPEWFGDLTWPAFNPFTPNQSFDAIPAGYRYKNPGQEAPGVGSTSTSPTQPPTLARIRRIN